MRSVRQQRKKQKGKENAAVKEEVDAAEPAEEPWLAKESAAVDNSVIAPFASNMGANTHLVMPSLTAQMRTGQAEVSAVQVLLWPLLPSASAPNCHCRAMRHVFIEPVSIFAKHQPTPHMVGTRVS